MVYSQWQRNWRFTVILGLANWKKGRLTPPNEKKPPAKKCVMLASTVSSKYLSGMARKEGFQFRDTLTGFKWMGNAASDLIRHDQTFLFAYEVEIGNLLSSLFDSLFQSCCSCCSNSFDSVWFSAVRFIQHKAFLLVSILG